MISIRGQGFCRLVCVAMTLCALVGAVCSRAATQTLLPFQTQLWRYLDYGLLPAANWYATNYSDAAWKNNYGQFGYGEGDEHTLIGFGADPLAKHVTTYFRTSFTVTNPAVFNSMRLELLRDAGAVVYLNGSELFRSNLPAAPAPIGNDTYATTCLAAPEEAVLVTNVFAPSLLRLGTNFIAVEIHQCAPAGQDLSFDLAVRGELDTPAAAVTRGPYLQVGTSSNIIVRWRTSVPTTTRVRYGTSEGALTQSAVDFSSTTEHEILLPGLAPATKYFYDVGSDTEVLAGGATYFFQTAPVPGATAPVRIWAIGDFGTGFPAQQDVRDAYLNFTGTRYTDVWLMLGDNAYCCGADAEYQSYVFEVYPTLLRQTVVWPTVGNHDTAQSTAFSDNFPYFQIFTMPTNAQAGGTASGSEHYYSFEYANIHFVCLDSMARVLRSANSPMLSWLRADLANNTRDWVIAYWHHPPYTKGSHNSDAESDLAEMRSIVLPILEDFGVDLVLSGHSHSFERSYLIDGQYAASQFVSPTNFVSTNSGRIDVDGAYNKPAGGLGERRGTVYVVDGSSGGQGGGGALNHPVMYYSTLLPGSLVIDVDGQRLDGTFIDSAGVVQDYFTIDKRNATNVLPRLSIARAGTNAVLKWPTSVPDFVLESKRVLEPALPWTPSAANVVTNGRRKLVTVPSANGTNEFFRLRRQ